MMNNFNITQTKVGIIFLIVIAHVNCLGNKVDSKNDASSCQEVNNLWLTEVLNLTKTTVGFSAPVSARALMYFNVGLYESSLLVLPNNQTLVGQISGLERKSISIQTEGLVPAIVNNEVAFALVKYLYKVMPPAKQTELNGLYKRIYVKYAKVNKKKVRNSLEYGRQLANELIVWSKLDGADECYNQNFPKTYVIRDCDSCWIKTYPGYNSALQPYWGQNTLMINSNRAISNDIPYIGFSTDTSSIIFKDAKSIFQLYSEDNLTEEMKVIAEYWNDAPGYSGTPAGHFYALALQLSRERKLNLKESVEMFASLGIAINDAVIETFRLKYEFNLLRPITYISKYIGKGFNTVIPSPPFPEFPSGHSYQSGAGSEILKAFLGDDFIFADSTNCQRVDIVGKPRVFESITAMSEEISLSRYYGGIHFLYTLNTSLVYGRKIGVNTIANLNFEKK